MTAEKINALEMRAEFPLARRAQAFAETIRRPGWWTKNVVRTGKVVTWRPNIPELDEFYNDDVAMFLEDWRGTVRHLGSDMSRQAKLNGVPVGRGY